MSRIWLAAGVAALLSSTALVAPALAQNTAAATAARDPLAAHKFGTWGFDTAGMNKAVKPGDDFNAFANGGWLERTEIPSDRSNFGNFYLLRELSDARVRDIIETTAAKPQLSGEEAKIGAYYRSFMDEARLETLDAAPMKAGLDEIRAARTHQDLARLQGANHGRFGVTLFGYGVYDDAKNPKYATAYIGHGGLGLPDRDFYLKPEFAERKAKYQAYVAQLLDMAGWANPQASAAAVVAYETRLAEAHWPIEDRRDDGKIYNPSSFAGLERDAPGFPWRAYAQGAGVPFDGKLVVAENTAFPKLAAIYAETPVATLQAWEAFHLADQSAPYLSKRFVEANYGFRLKEMEGQPEQRPRWKRGVTLVNDNLGHAVGKIYVARYFGPEAKAQMDQLVNDLKAALKARIERVTWMSPETKARAQEKLAKFRSNIGYPPKYRDFSALEVRADDLYGNVQRTAAFDWDYQKGKLGKLVDKEEWTRPPQMVNAWYRTQRNDISFPAGILMPPFFDPEADPAVNYGAIGGVIGHEIIHGFDDNGRKSDGDGLLTDWWTAEDAAKFEVQATRLADQYSAYEPLPGAKVNGRLTLGENMADLAGLLMALDAYKIHLDGRPAPVIDGYTGEQRLFLGWAQFWRTKYRDAYLRQYVATDEHAPAMYRAGGPVRNIDAWYAAWGVKPGDKLYLAPEDRVRIW